MISTAASRVMRATVNRWAFFALLTVTLTVGVNCDSGSVLNTPVDGEGTDLEEHSPSRGIFSFRIVGTGGNPFSAGGIATIEATNYRLLTDTLGSYSVPILSPDGSLALLTRAPTAGAGFFLGLSTSEIIELLGADSATNGFESVELEAKTAIWGLDSRFIIYRNTIGIAGGDRTAYRYDLDSRQIVQSPWNLIPQDVISEDMFLALQLVAGKKRPLAVFVDTHFSWLVPVRNLRLESHSLKSIRWNKDTRQFLFSFREDGFTRIGITDSAGLNETIYDIGPFDAVDPVWGPPNHVLFTLAENFFAGGDFQPYICILDLQSGVHTALLKGSEVQGGSMLQLGGYYDVQMQ